MTRPSAPANHHAAHVRDVRLNHLVTRIAARDRVAFRALYAVLAMPVWKCAIGQLSPADARAVTRSTFVEIWHLAGHHPDREGHQTWGWVLSIVARRVDDRMRSAGGQPIDGNGHDHHTHQELIALLGNDAAIRPLPAEVTLAVRVPEVPPTVGREG